jgi:hypothetical protein
MLLSVFNVYKPDRHKPVHGTAPADHATSLNAAA